MRKLSLLLILLALPTWVVSQTPTGTVEGTIADAQGAAVVGASITVTNNATGIAKKIVSDGSGRFQLPFTNPGTYTITVEAKGFRTEKREGVVVQVSETLPLAFTLKVGQISETVEVSTTAGTLDTESSSLDTVVQTRAISDLPLNGRNPFALAELVPGVSTIGDASTPHIGGSRNANNEQQIDGMTNILPENNVGNNETAYQPIVDSIQEFSVQTSVLPADYGRFSGGTISLVTKAGGEKFHGSAFEFARNAVLDAPSYEFGGTPSKGNLYRYQTGGTIGGPILLDRSKHSFFFFAYEKSQENNAASETDTVPQPQWATGDFSDLIPAGHDCNATPIAGCIYDPNTVAEVGGQFVRQAFPGNIIPTDRLSPVAVNVMKYYPAPNFGSFDPASPAATNLHVNGTSTDNYYHWDLRLDHDFGAKWHSFLRMSHWSENQVPLSDYNNAASQGYAGPAHITEWSGTFNNTFTFSPTLLGEVRYGVSRQAYNRTTFGQPFDLASLGFNAAYVSTAAKDGLIFPNFNLSQGFSGIGSNGYNSYYENPMAHDVTGSLVKIVGAHSVKVGGEFRKLFENFTQFGHPSGSFNIDQSWTQDVATGGVTDSTGNAFASMLLGLPASGAMTHDPYATDASAYIAVFGQDDWKVTKKLTLNLGLRWDVEIPRTDRFNQLSYWNPNLPSPLAGAVPAGACPACGSLMGAMEFVGVPGAKYGRSQGPIQKKDFGPRVGFAYNATHSLVFRGGYGIVYAPSALQAAGTDGSPGIEGFSSQTQFTSSFTNQQTAPSACTTCATLDNPAPTGFNLPKGVAGGTATDIGSGITDSFFGSYRNPYSEQYNFNIQYGLPGNATVEVGYLGNHGLFLINGDPGVNYDQLPISDLALGNQLTTQVPNPFFGLITTPGSPLSQPTIQYSQLISPYPQYTGVQSFRKPQGASMYNGFTAKFDKRFSHGLTLLASFTGSKLEDNSTSAVNYLGATSQTFANEFNPRGEWAVSAQDVSRILVVSYTYELPFGRGKAFLGNANRIVNGFVGGWQTVGLVQWDSGTPVVLASPGNNTHIGTFAQRPLWNGQDAKIGDPTLDHWFNTAVFSQLPPFEIGNAPRTIPDVRVPGLSNSDLSFFKNNYFGTDGRFNAQFRVEMFNAFNHPWFGAPDANVNDGSKFGTITSMATDYSPRNIQLAVKFIF
jgi:carboxypeptidase family protein/TonB-dependent receptor-like protein